MSWFDWVIVVVPLTIIVWLAFHARKFARSAVDFLVSGRVAGRYVLCVGDLTVALSVITLVAGVEQNYQTGYGVIFWNSVAAPIGIVISLTGFCLYRWRETRCLSKGQFIELRYGSKPLRVFTAILSTFSEAITNALGPAIAANFFIYYLKLPHKIMIFGIGLPCYIIIVALCLALALAIIWPAGRISLLITDSFQGLLSYPIFVMMVGFILLKFGWNTDITPILWDRAPQESFINPYDISHLRDFNVFALVVSLVSGILNRASWIGNDSGGSAKSPHEQKMSGILAAWKNGFAYMMITLIAIMIYAFMNNGNFSVRGSEQRFKVTNDDIRKELSCRVFEEIIPDDAERMKLEAAVKAIPDQHHVIGVDAPLSQKNNLDTVYFDTVRNVLGDTPDARFKYQKHRTLFGQMMMPTVLRNILPAGMLGIFALLMVMLLISTDDSRIFNAASCCVQDIIIPFYKKDIDAKAHIKLLRMASLGVTIFFFIVACFFQNLDYINMVTTILCALWLGGAGPIMVFGLYTRFGNRCGCWCALIFGSGFSFIGLVLQHTWAKTVYPFLENHGWVNACDRVLRAASAPFEPWIHWEMSAVKFPINSWEIFGCSMALAVTAYIVGSYLTYKPFNLDKLLHRGIYSDNQSLQPEPWKWRNLFSKLLAITPEYTRGDKIIAWGIFFYSFVWGVGILFLAVAVWNAFFAWPHSWWNAYFFVTNVLAPGIVGIVSTVWFMAGGIIDLRRLFIDLAKRVSDPLDNGQVRQSDKN